MRSQPTPKPIRQLAHNLVEAGGYFSVVISQMAHFAARHPNPDGKSIPDVLHELVEGILADQLKAHPQDVATAARVISAAIDAISENLLFVDESFMEEAECSPELN
jgi:hypothetical protein